MPHAGHCTSVFLEPGREIGNCLGIASRSEGGPHKPGLPWRVPTGEGSQHYVSTATLEALTLSSLALSVAGTFPALQIKKWNRPYYNELKKTPELGCGGLTPGEGSRVAGWLGVLKSGAPRPKSWSDQCLDSGLGKLPDLLEPPCLPLGAGADNGHTLHVSSMRAGTCLCCFLL